MITYSEKNLITRNMLLSGSAQYQTIFCSSLYTNACRILKTTLSHKDAHAHIFRLIIETNLIPTKASIVNIQLSITVNSSELMRF